jgi:hypothetical protein
MNLYEVGNTLFNHIPQNSSKGIVCFILFAPYTLLFIIYLSYTNRKKLNKFAQFLIVLKNELTLNSQCGKLIEYLHIQEEKQQWKIVRT